MFKVNKWTQELIQLDPHQAPNPRAPNTKTRQILLSSHHMQAE